MPSESEPLGESLNAPHDGSGETPARRSSGAALSFPIVVGLWASIMLAPAWLFQSNDLPKLANTFFGVAAGAAGVATITLWLALRTLETIDRKRVNGPLILANVTGALMAELLRQVHVGINCREFHRRTHGYRCRTPPSQAVVPRSRASLMAPQDLQMRPWTPIGSLEMSTPQE